MTRVLAIAGLLCLSLFAGDGGAAYAQQGRVIQTLPKQLKTPKRAHRPVVEEPKWDIKPSGDEVAEYYPAAAGSRGLDGRATISCAVRASGILSNCLLVSESPEGYGFGEAAIKLSSRFKMKPRMVDGVPVEGGSVRIPISFSSPEPDPQSLKPVEATAAPTLTSEQYAKALGQAATCQQLLKVAAFVEDARPLILNAANENKDEFETSDDFVERYNRGVFDPLGGARFLIVKLKLSDNGLSYDADREIFSYEWKRIEGGSDPNCIRVCTVKWQLEDVAFSRRVEFSVPLDVAPKVKNGSHIVIGYPIDKMRIKRDGGRLSMTSDSRCTVLVSGEGAFAATSPLWFDRPAGY